MSRDDALVLYDYGPSANCFKARLLLHLLREPYERVAVDIFAGETLTEEFARMNPARRTPVLRTRAGEFLPESNAILLYLAESTPYLPTDLELRAQTYRWLLFEQSLLEPTVGGARFRRLTGRAELDPDRFHQLHAAAVEALSMLDRGLDGREWLVGNALSVADLSLYAYSHVAADADIDLDRFPNVGRWLAAVAETPGFMHDLEPYPENARPGRGRSVHG